MVRLATSIVFLATASAAQACPSFGLETEYLSEFFCRELGDLAGPTTRNMGTATSRADDPQPAPDWMELPVISEAWRVDPAATLELIERIRAAGGGPIN